MIQYTRAAFLVYQPVACSLCISSQPSSMSGTAYERGTLARMDEVNYLYHDAFGGTFALASGLLASRSVSGVLHT
jgi:hypothetical protein